MSLVLQNQASATEVGNYDFLITALPRSGTAWLANFLSHGDVSICLHEPEVYGQVDVQGFRFVGCASLGNAVLNRQCKKQIIIDRNPQESYLSMLKFCKNRGLKFLRWSDFESSIEIFNEYRSQLTEKLTIPYKVLFDIKTCRTLWEFAFDEAIEFPVIRCEQLLKFNVQI